MGDLKINAASVRVFKNEFGYVDTTLRSRQISCEVKVQRTVNMLRAGGDQAVECGEFREAGTIVSTLNTDSISVTEIRLESGEVIYVPAEDVATFLDACDACCN